MCLISVEDDSPYVYEEKPTKSKVVGDYIHWYYTGVLLLDKKSIEELLSAFSWAISYSPDCVNGRRCRAVINRIFDLSFLNRSF